MSSIGGATWLTWLKVFLVASISTGLLSFFSEVASNPSQIAQTLAQSLPQAANYFLSYITIQALGNSASALLQVMTLFLWFIWASIMDSTPRQKWRRQTKLSNIQWGSFFPPFTNFAVIGLIYSVMAPLILPFMILVFGLFWIVYRYNVLYVYSFRNDTGGLLFPVAANQLFVGLYTMEICLAGLFFLARDPDNNVAAVPEGVIMVVALVLTAGYQWLLNSTFSPLYRYMPITLEDDAVERDEEFARAQASKLDAERAEAAEESQNGGKDIQEQLEEREKAEKDADKEAEEMEKSDIEQRRRKGTPGPHTHDSWHNTEPSSSWKGDRWRRVGQAALQPVQGVLKITDRAEEKLGQGLKGMNDALDNRIAATSGLSRTMTSNDPEAQETAGDLLFSGLADELEDLTVDERDLLVQIAFQHSALRARRPVVWIPQDELGVSNDEIRRAKKMSDHLPMSNAGAQLDAKGRVVFEKSPPDFSNIDLISL